MNGHGDIDRLRREVGAVPYKVKPTPTRDEAIQFGIDRCKEQMKGRMLTEDDIGRVIGQIIVAVVDYCLGTDAPASPAHP